METDASAIESINNTQCPVYKSKTVGRIEAKGSENQQTGYQMRDKVQKNRILAKLKINK